MRNVFKVIALSSLLSLSACSWWGGKDDEDNSPFKGFTEEQLYKEAKENLDNAQYASAIKRLEAMESMYPFSTHAEAAHAKLIYAYYENEEYASAAASSERFIHLYPRSPRVDYAYYMKAMANFKQQRGSFAKVIPLDESYRDPGTQKEAYSDFAVLVEKFPNSPYKKDALKRMIYLRNIFADRELHAAEYFYARKLYVAAQERAKYLIKTYPQSPSVMQALAIIYHANMELGLQDAANDAMRVFQTTYPGRNMPPVQTEFD